ncbi:flagellar motor protein MotB [Xanthomonas euroxanthea]|uniref:flagellar motor protein MotB n=1 Tax=Xanthomonas euroxanthea TaxID=2259622 RepID=UPI003CCD5A0C
MAHGHHGGAWKVAFADFVTAIPESRIPNLSPAASAAAGFDCVRWCWRLSVACAMQALAPALYFAALQAAFE